MFRLLWELARVTLISSLSPTSEFAQKEVSVVARLADVMQDGAAAQLAGIVYQQIAKAEYSLRNTGGNRDVLNLGERDVPGGARYQTRINLNF